MVEATIRSIDHNERRVVVEMDDGKRVTLQFGVSSHIEVTEPCSGGTQGGTLQDLGVGYIVQVDYHEDATCNGMRCTNLISIS